MSEFIKELITMFQEGIDEPSELILSVILALSILFPLGIKLINVISLTQFDRFFIPKKEKTFQQLFLKISEYVNFSFIYLLIGLILAFLTTKALNAIERIIPFVILTFLLSFLILQLRIAFKKNGIKKFLLLILKVLVLLSKVLKIHRYIDNFQTTRFYNILCMVLEFIFIKRIFEINFSSGMLMFGFIWVAIINSSAEFNIQNTLFYLFIFFIPAFLLYFYRQVSLYKTREGKYVCKVISESEFNRAEAIVKYSLDENRILFSKGESVEEEIYYLFDRSLNTYMSFTKKNEESSGSNSTLHTNR